jgi:integrase
MPRASHVPTEPEIAALLSRAEPALRLTLILLADAGCRLREALAFDVSSLSAANLRIWSTKTSKWRTVPTTARLRAALAHLSSASLRTLSPRQVQRRVSELCRLLQIEPTSPHRFRHSYATRLYLAGVPAHVIMQLLGHTSLALTMHYIHAADTDFELAAAALDRSAATHRGTIERQPGEADR